MVDGYLKKFLFNVRHFKSKRLRGVNWGLRWCHYSANHHSEDVLPLEWYKKAFPKITQLSQQLRHVDFIDGRLVNMDGGSVIFDDNIQHKMHTLKSLARVFVGHPSVQKKLSDDVMALGSDRKHRLLALFANANEREPMVINSLTKVGDYLNVSAQQRKQVRLTICPQVTQHRIWRGALEKVLKELKLDLDSWNCHCPDKGDNMGQQIIYSCLRLLDDMNISYDDDSTSWMRLVPNKKVDSESSSKWEDVLEMFNDLIGQVKTEKSLHNHASKLEAMKEGLAQIKDVLIDKDIGYREARYQESLVEKNLSKTLGHSSGCLFTLLSYYLCGYVSDIEVDMRGGVYDRDGKGKRSLLCMGRILTTDEGKMVRNGVKQLDRALGIFKFVRETAGIKGALELQGHLWCVGAKERTFTYRGNQYFVHEISF